MPMGIPDDLTGRHFGRWTVLNRDETRKDKKVYWWCRCTCGVVKSVQANNLRSGQSTKCQSCSLRQRSRRRWDKVSKPLLLIDVDGPLNPEMSNNSFAKYNRRNPSWPFTMHRLAGYRVWLNPWHGKQLLSLADQFELTWCTTWERDANVWIGPHLGLPKLPVIEWDKKRIGSGDGTYFKTHEVVAYAKGRPFAWIDDQISIKDEEYVEAHHDGPARLLWINPAAGLRNPDFDLLANWADSLKEVPTKKATGET